MQSDWINNDLSPVVYGDIALSINTQYKKKKKKKKKIVEAMGHVICVFYVCSICPFRH